jgi:hypothetical protein
MGAYVFARCAVDERCHLTLSIWITGRSGSAQLVPYLVLNATQPERAHHFLKARI